MSRPQNHTNNILRKLPLQILATAFFVSCLSPIELKTDNIGGTVVISGQISTQRDRSVVNVGVTASSDRLPIPVSGASVTAHDDEGNVLNYFEKSEGTYLPSPGAAGVPGRTYFIRVSFPGGTVYESVPEKIESAVGTDSVYYEIVSEEVVDHEGAISSRPFIKIYTNSDFPQTASPHLVKWEVEGVYVIVPTDFPDPWGNRVPPNCFVTQATEPQRIVLYNSTEINTRHLTDVLLASRVVDNSFYTRYYFTIYQSTLSPEAYEYWRRINIVANQVGSIFDSPPAEVRGNIAAVGRPSEKVFGYFQAVNQSFERFFVSPDDLPFRFPIYCEFITIRDYRTYPPECLDCTMVRGSSFERPEWWE